MIWRNIMMRTSRIAVITASVATAGVLGLGGVAYAGDYDGDDGGHHSHHGGHHGHDHDGWDRGDHDRGGWGHGRCGRDRGLVGNLLHDLLDGGRC
jgi:hypothetical protein